MGIFLIVRLEQCRQINLRQGRLPRGQLFRECLLGGQTQDMVNGSRCRLEHFRGRRQLPLRRRGGSKAGAGAGGAISGVAGDGTRKVLVDARLPLRGYLLLGADGRRGTRRCRRTDSRLNSKGMFIIARSRDTGQILAGKVTEMDVLRADTLEAGDGLLGSTNGGELGDQVILAGPFDGLELRGVGMCQMVEIKGIGDETSLVSVTLTRRPMTSKDIPHVELRLFPFPFTLIDLVKRGLDIEFASLTT